MHNFWKICPGENMWKLASAVAGGGAGEGGKIYTTQISRETAKHNWNEAEHDSPKASRVGRIVGYGVFVRDKGWGRKEGWREKGEHQGRKEEEENARKEGRV